MLFRFLVDSFSAKDASGLWKKEMKTDIKK